MGDPYAFDEAIRKKGYAVIAGVDEAGRGPLAGPVVAAAVILPQEARIPGVRDSKKVAPQERELLYSEIMRQAVAVGIGAVDAQEIDRINILQATRHAMHDAVTGLGRKADMVLVDALNIPSIQMQQMPIIKGDAKSASIAAASIIAKVTRDRIMAQYHTQYPCYGFDRHKGYATKMHCASLLKYGPCPIHRMTFQKVLTMPLPLAGGVKSGKRKS